MLETLIYQPRQVLETPKQEATRQLYRTRDLEQLSSIVLYTGDIRPTAGGFIIPLGDLGLGEEGIKDVHETYRVDKEGDLSYGHLTFVTKENKKKRIFYDEEK